MLKTFSVIAAITSIFLITRITNLPIELRDWLAETKSRVVVGNDLAQAKILYLDLFDHNTRQYHLAGKPSFPINTDTLRYVTAEKINQYQQGHLRELLNSLAYERKERLDHEVTARTEKRTLLVSTNQPIQIASISHKRRIKQISLRSLDQMPLENVEMSLTPDAQPKPTTGAATPQMIAELLQKFAPLHQEGASPVGMDFRLSFDEFSKVYGYGQCANLSYAFCDLLSQYGIKTQILHLRGASHVLLQAQTTNGWMAVDPKLGIAFISSNQQSPLSFLEVRADIDRTIQTLHLAQPTQQQLRQYYQSAEIPEIEQYKPVPATRDYTFTLSNEETVEYDFKSTYPWLTARNVTPPPDNVLGAFKQKFHLRDRKAVHTPFPVVDVEARGITGAASLFVNDQAVSFDAKWDFVRLRRYFENGEDNLRLNVAGNPAGVDITVISQFSSLPFDTNSGAYLLIKASRDTQVKVEVEFY